MYPLKFIGAFAFVLSAALPFHLFAKETELVAPPPAHSVPAPVESPEVLECPAIVRSLVLHYDEILIKRIDALINRPHVGAELLREDYLLMYVVQQKLEEMKEKKKNILGEWWRVLTGERIENQYRYEIFYDVMMKPHLAAYSHLFEETLPRSVSAEIKRITMKWGAMKRLGYYKLSDAFRRVPDIDIYKLDPLRKEALEDLVDNNIHFLRGYFFQEIESDLSRAQPIWADDWTEGRFKNKGYLKDLAFELVIDALRRDQL